MAGEDREYTAFIHSKPCCGPGCSNGALAVQAHHITNGLMVPPGQPLPPKMRSARKGRGQKPHDYFQIPLCIKCHAQLHDRSGKFRDMSKQRLDAWQLEMVTYHRCLYEEQQGTQEWLDSLPF